MLCIKKAIIAAQTIIINSMAKNGSDFVNCYPRSLMLTFIGLLPTSKWTVIQPFLPSSMADVNRDMGSGS
jgi:hypothetical protein